MGMVQLCVPKAISDIWFKSFFIWSTLKIIRPQCTQFLLVAHMDFLVMTYKDEPQDL